MNITQRKSFTFSQYRIQNSGGWCYGISAAIITHLHENIHGIISPHEAYCFTQSYVGILNASYDQLMSCVAPGFHEFRNNIELIQCELNSPFNAPGRYVYNFNRRGVYLLLVNVNSSHHGYGEIFQGRFSVFGQSANHAGVIVLAPSEIFIFDPNCGGVLFSWTGDNNSENMPFIIDMMLEQMYCLSDRMKGDRKAKVVSCITLDNPYFGRV